MGWTSHAGAGNFVAGWRRHRGLAMAGNRWGVLPVSGWAVNLFGARKAAAAIFILALPQFDVAHAMDASFDQALREAARASGEPRVPGLKIVYLHPLGPPERANAWRNIIVHQTEGPAGSARGGALAQAKNPTRRGVTIWVETDGTVYWATAETAIPTHGDGANRNDNKYVDNAATYRAVLKHNSIGVEFAGNFPDVAAPATPAQQQAWVILARFLQERYAIPAERIYAHNWIDYKDARYCEGCDLATAARRLNYMPSSVGTRR
jgi:hypothetical protein